ncbi:hypothetical protein MGG_17202 [Pyricularia oryzae 70-15]|uniref:Uncharacterized protein n=1 Tax=Pyricularia oryzae (strain 70-15 / ATCC MYA-4617 / FGSC 8958) TaxID=242507 RepID=G4N8E6_PYRO7|nr:uncharacterized protein MGG_17202 [Pyricularia oryzae 70-15]EHA50994.1 hypothetical protein MGG_17202 [Pyricularia oryzae 70-15]
MSASTSNEPGIPRGSEARLVVFKGMIFVDGKLEWINPRVNGDRTRKPVLDE